MQGIGNEFMEMTRYENTVLTDQQKGLAQPPLEQDYDLTSPTIKLPSPRGFGNRPVIDVINNRRSLRKYLPTPLLMEQLSYLLWCTQGVQSVKNKTATLRTVPSAGARHAFETYLLVNNVKDLHKGLYRFLALENKLIEVNRSEDITEAIVAGCLGQGFVGSSAVTFVWVADVKRMKWRYGERGYRYLHLDAGHVCQNLYLAAESISCGACAIAAFDDNEMNKTLEIDGKEQFVIYVATVGMR